MIEFYGHFGDHSTALDIFNTINSRKKDHIMIGTMMKCLMNNQCNQRVLEIYDLYPQFHDSISYSFALKACIHLNDSKKGQSIIDDLNQNKMDRNNDIIQSTLIEYYGHFGDIDEAVNIFNAIPNHQKDAVSGAI